MLLLCCGPGVVANVTVAVCNKSSRYYWGWYCSQKNVARSLFTAVLPPLLLMLWQSMVMPNVLYRFAWVRHESGMLAVRHHHSACFVIPLIDWIFGYTFPRIH